MKPPPLSLNQQVSSYNIPSMDSTNNSGSHHSSASGGGGGHGHDVDLDLDSHPFFNSTTTTTTTNSSSTPYFDPLAFLSPPPPPQKIKITGDKNPKKRSRASRRAPTTVLTTDTSNFRQMVQEFTGIPTPPYSYARPRFDGSFLNHAPSKFHFSTLDHHAILTPPPAPLHLPTHDLNYQGLHERDGHVAGLPPGFIGSGWGQDVDGDPTRLRGT